LGGILFL